MMADDSSRQAYVKDEAVFQGPTANIVDDLTNYTNGEHKQMERERVKKKGSGIKPGNAVIMSGTSAHPPIHDDPIDMADANEYVMQYTDIFASGDSSGPLDEGGDVVESSDTEIVGHSEDHALYEKSTVDDSDDDDDDDNETHDGPPPLDSEDDYEYDDSDLGLTPPPVGSDASEGERGQSSVNSSPAKSISSTEEGNLITQKETLTRCESHESDPGYREGPPPFDSDEECEPPTVENGVETHSDETPLDENMDENMDENLADQEEISDDEKEMAEDVRQDSEEEIEEDENAELIQGDQSGDVTKYEDSESSSEELPEDEQVMLRTRSPTEDEMEQPASAAESPKPVDVDESQHASLVMSASPAMSASPEPVVKQEDDSKASERVETPEPLPNQEPQETLSDPEEPLLHDEPPAVEIPAPQPKKQKSYLKEKGNTVEKSALLNSDSSDDEDEIPTVEHAQNTRSYLSDSDSDNENKEVEIVPFKYTKDSGHKKFAGLTEVGVPREAATKTKASKNTSSKQDSSVETTKKASAKQTKSSTQEKKPREAVSRSSNVSTENNEQVNKKIKVSKTTQVAKATDQSYRRKQAPGLAVKDEKPKVTKKSVSNQQVRVKHAPGLAVKEDVSKAKDRDDSKAGKTKEVKEDPRKGGKSAVDTGIKKHQTNTQGKLTNTNSGNVKKEAKHVGSVKGEGKSPVGNGEVKKVKHRPKISKSKYSAIATEDDYDDEEEDETLVEEQKPSEKTAEPRPTHREPKTRHSSHEAERKERHHGKSGIVHDHHARGHGKHDRSKHVWLCRDDEIHKLIAQKASLLKEYESGSLAGRNVFSGQKVRHRKDEEEAVHTLPDVEFASSKPKSRHARPMSEIIPDREPYTSRKRENRRSLQHRYSGSSSEDDDDERTNKMAGYLRADKAAPGGTFSVGMASRNFSKSEEPSDSEHEETCEYCAAEKATKQAQERDLAWEGPHHPRNLLLGVVYTAKYLGSSQIMSPQSPNRNVRMQQAQEAVGRIKVPEGEDQPTTDVDVFISTERIKVVNSANKDIMMDHALRTVSFIADIGDVLVLMARRPPGNNENILETKPSATQILASVAKAETDPKMIKITCHVFQAPEAQIIAKSIGQAFNVAYQEFLRTNGISEDTIEDAEYNCVLEAQKILGEDLSLLSDASKSREVVVNKKPGESLGVMIVESGWGSMIPTAIIAHLAKEGPAAKSGRLNVGDQILAINNTSLVGLPLPECQTIIKNSRPGTKVVMKAVSCPPTVQVVVNRPDTKYQLGFSVQNGMICSLMRGSIAERGGVRVGHRIIEINGESVVATSHQHIVDLLASTTGEIRMKTMPASMYRLLVGLDTPQYI